MFVFVFDFWHYLKFLKSDLINIVYLCLDWWNTELWICIDSMQVKLDFGVSEFYVITFKSWLLHQFSILKLALNG